MIPDDDQPVSTLYDIAVVGAGPAGLTTALALADAGARLALVGPAAPTTDHRTSALFGSSIDLLDRLGVFASLKEAAAPLATMRLVDGTRRLIRAPEVTFRAREIGRDVFGYNLANRALVAALEDGVRAKAVRIDRFEVPLVSLDLAGPTPALRLDDGRTISAALVVGADGRRSPVRTGAGIAVDTWSYPQSALVVNLEHTGSHDDTSTEFHTETGPFTLVPLGHNRSSLVMVETPETVGRLMALEDGEFARELERRSHALLGRLTIAGPRQSWPMSAFKARRLAIPGVVLVGEAAHGFPPIGAQGLNLTMRDAAALAGLVGGRLASGSDLGTAEFASAYGKLRIGDVAGRVYGVDLLNRSLLAGALPVQLARSLVLDLARSLGPLRRALMREGLGASG